MSELFKMTPNQRDEEVLRALRAAKDPLTLYDATDQTLRQINAGGPLPSRQDVLLARTHVLEALYELNRQLRIRIIKNPKDTSVYEPVCRTPEVEQAVNAITDALGGRRPEAVGDGEDPIVTWEAPLSAFVEWLTPMREVTQ